jgi:hypothetical protein
VVRIAKATHANTTRRRWATHHLARPTIVSRALGESVGTRAPGSWGGGVLRLVALFIGFLS